jgi:hypothetical protein
LAAKNAVQAHSLIRQESRVRPNQNSRQRSLSLSLTRGALSEEEGKAKKQKGKTREKSKQNNSADGKSKWKLIFVDAASEFKRRLSMPTAAFVVHFYAFAASPRFRGKECPLYFSAMRILAQDAITSH